MTLAFMCHSLDSKAVMMIWKEGGRRLLQRCQSRSYTCTDTHRRTKEQREAMTHLPKRGSQSVMQLRSNKERERK